MSTKYPNLPLFLLVDKHLWSSQEYHFQFMSHMGDEETVMTHNLIPVLIFKYEDEAKTYCFPEDAETAKYDYWDKNLKGVM